MSSGTVALGVHVRKVYLFVRSSFIRLFIYSNAPPLFPSVGPNPTPDLPPLSQTEGPEGGGRPRGTTRTGGRVEGLRGRQPRLRVRRDHGEDEGWDHLRITMNVPCFVKTKSKTLVKSFLVKSSHTLLSHPLVSLGADRRELRRGFEEK